MDFRRRANFEIVGGNIAKEDFMNWRSTLIETGFTDDEINYIFFATAKEDLRRRVARSGKSLDEFVLERLWADIENENFDDDDEGD